MKCFIREKVYQDGYEVFFFEERQGKNFILRPSGNWIERPSGELVSWEEYSKDAWNFPREAFLKMISQAASMNIKTENESKTVGILEATKFHLEDMRKLVFKSGEKTT